MINIYSPEEIKKIGKSGAITSMAVDQLIKLAVPGVTTLELDSEAEKIIRSQGAEPSFMMEPGYRFTTCMQVNDMVVHGIPTNYQLSKGDRLGIDVGAVLDSFHSDASWSIIVGDDGHSPELDPIRQFLETGKTALKEAISLCRPGNRIGHLSQKIQEIVEGNGYSCVKQLVGHGVGHKLHEDPEIPCYLRGKVENTPEIKIGMVLAVEIIYNMGESALVYENDDGWTIVTRDRSPSGLFEKTVAITPNGPEILTP
jgi:methionyl aminopeptidase